MPCDNICDGPLGGGPPFGGNCPPPPLPFGGGFAPPPCTCLAPPGQCYPGGTGSIASGGANVLCFCLSTETEVSIYQSSPKLAANIGVGDKLVSAEGCPEVVVAVARAIQPLVRVSWSGGEIVVSRSHHFLDAHGAEVEAESLSVGDEILGADSEPRKLSAVDADGEGEVVSFTCRPTHVYQAAGLLHHNKATPATYPQAML